MRLNRRFQRRLCRNLVKFTTTARRIPGVRWRAADGVSPNVSRSAPRHQWLEWRTVWRQVQIAKKPLDERSFAISAFHARKYCVILCDLLPAHVITAIYADCSTTQYMGLRIEICFDHWTVTAIHPQMTLRRHVSSKCDIKRFELRKAIADRQCRWLFKLLTTCFIWVDSLESCTSGAGAAVGYTPIRPIEHGCGVGG